MFASGNGKRLWSEDGRGIGAGGVDVDSPDLGGASAGSNAGPGGSGMKTGAGHKPQAYDAHGRYTGPNVNAQGGSVSMRDGSISIFGQDGRMYTDAGKQAGADSEAGRREPKSLLSATSEQLERIAAGTGQAVTQGAAGAKQAISRTWEELSTNEELHKGVEFGVKAAGEVSKDVAGAVLADTGLNLWDTAGAEAAERMGWKRAAAVLANPGITVPLNKAVGFKRAFDGVWGGGHEQDTRALSKRIDGTYEQVYGRKR